jgi:monoamine oxidase
MSSIFEPRIVIVGAGIAGLNCAHHLRKLGQRAQVYEAGCRVGGRIFSAPKLLGAHLITEVGGEFIDSHHRDILDLVFELREFGLLLYDAKLKLGGGLAPPQDEYFFGGKQYAVAEVVDAFQPYAAQIAGDIALLPPRFAFDEENAVAARFDQLSIADYFDSLGMRGQIRALLEVAYLTEYGREVGEQSALNFLSLFSPDTRGGTLALFGKSDERYKIAGGNQRLTEALFRQVSGQVSLSHTLTELSQEADEYELTFVLADGTYKKVAADYVVLAIPFTVLRNVRLNLPLPAWKRNAIEALGYGTHAKVFLGFEESLRAPGALFSDQALQNGWWTVGGESVPQSAYTVYLGGQAGLDVGTEFQGGQFLGVLDAAFPGIQARFNGRVKRFQWSSVPFALGSYSCYLVGQYTTIAGAEGRRVGNLFFAGEHCSSAYQGFMNGGAETGRIAARAIADTLAVRRAVAS